MRRLLAPLVVLIALAGVALFLIMNLDSGEQDATFSIKDSDKVASIFIADRANNKVLLERTDEGWWKLNKEYRAKQPEVEAMLNVLEKLSVRKPIPKSASQNVIADMATNNTKVEVQDKDGDVMLSFLLGAPAPDNVGNYAKREDSRDLYIIQIPGFEGTMDTRFHANETQWRDRAVFRYEPYTIEAVELKYLNEPEKSFKIEVLARDSFDLEPLSEEAPTHVAEPNPRMLAQYINNFREVHAEAYVNDLGGKDTILAQGPYLIMTVTDTAGQKNVVKLFRKPVSGRTKQQFDPEGNPMLFDSERSYALINQGRDFVLIQQFAFGKLIREYGSFYRPF